MCVRPWMKVRLRVVVRVVMRVEAAAAWVPLGVTSRAKIGVPA